MELNGDKPLPRLEKIKANRFYYNGIGLYLPLSPSISLLSP